MQSHDTALANGLVASVGLQRRELACPMKMTMMVMTMTMMMLMMVVTIVMTSTFRWGGMLRLHIPS